MNRAEALRKEIADILIKPTAWGPMLVQRARIALQQASAMINDLDMQINVYESRRSDAQIARNLEIIKRFDEGEKQADLAQKYGLTKQRINRIILMTRKHLERTDGTPRTPRVSRKRDSGVKKAARARKQKDRPANTNGGRKDSNSGINYPVGARQGKAGDLHGSGIVSHHADD